MKILKNERGIALVTSLLLTMIALAIVMALLYIITWQTQLSAAHKRYKTSLEASHGGAEIFAKQIIPQIINSTSLVGLAGQFGSIGMVFSNNTSCVKAKVKSATADWKGICSPTSANFDPSQQADVQLTLQGSGTNYNVYAKIVDTIPGNSDLSGFDLLDSGSGVTGVASGVAPKHLPGMYRIEVLGQKQLNPLEKAQLSILYAY